MLEKKDLNYIYEFFNRIEVKYDLLRYQIEDVFVWKLIRTTVWNKVIQEVGLIDSPHPKNTQILFRE